MTADKYLENDYFYLLSCSLLPINSETSKFWICTYVLKNQIVLFEICRYSGTPVGKVLPASLTLHTIWTRGRGSSCPSYTDVLTNIWKPHACLVLIDSYEVILDQPWAYAVVNMRVLFWFITKMRLPVDEHAVKTGRFFSASQATRAVLMHTTEKFSI